jgi:hypothetical protein
LVKLGKGAYAHTTAMRTAMIDTNSQYLGVWSFGVSV